MADPIATATVKIVGDTRTLTTDIEAAGTKIETAFTDAAREADSELKKIGGSDVWTDIRSDASVTGESIEDDMKEAARTSNAQLDTISTKSSGVFGGMRIAMAGLGILGVKAFGDIVNEASNLSESQNAVKVTFGESADEISRLGREAATAVGLSESQFNSLAVQFSSFATTVAGEGGDVATTMDDLTTRAADFASVMNLDVADAAQLFQSGLSGEAEGLKKFGIDMSAAAVEAEALAAGIIKPGEEMTNQQAIQARYSLLMKATSKTAGDFANTSDGLANQQRILKAQMANLGAEIGTALLPILASLAGFVVDTVIPAIRTIRENFEYIIPVLAGLGFALLAYNATAITTAVSSAAAWVVAAAPFIAIGVAIAAVVAGIIWAYQNVEIFRNVVDAMWEVIKKVASFLADVFVAAWNGVSAAIQFVVEKVQAVWDRTESLRGFLAGAFALAIDYVKLQFDIWKTAIQFVIDIVQALWDKSEGVRAFIAGAFGLAIDAIKLQFDVWKAAIQFVIDVLQAVWDKGIEVKDFLVGAFTTALDGIKVAFDLVKDAVQFLIDKLDDAWDSTEDLRAILSGAFDRALDGAETALGAVKDAVGFVSDALETAIGWVQSLIDWVKKIPTPSSIIGSIKDFGPGIPGFDLAAGKIVTRPEIHRVGEAGAEAVIPLTNPGRAMELMQQSGLGEMWSRAAGGGGALLSFPGAVFQDATDADLVAQRTVTALQSISL